MSSQEEIEPGVITKANDNIQVKVIKQPHCLFKFEISVTPEAVSAAYTKAFRNINKEVSIPGFRKGKAPDRLILERYQPAIQKEWIDVVLQVAFNEAIQLTHIHPLKDGQLKRPVVHECTMEKGAQFTIEFESRPVIPTIDPATISLKKFENIEVSQTDKDASLENVQRQFMTYEPIEDRGVQVGDFVNLDVDSIDDKPQRFVDNQRFKIDENLIPTWLLEKVVGLKPNETAEGVSAQEGTKPSPFKVTVREIWNGIPATIDDELAKKVGLQTLEELHNKILERLEEENKQLMQQKQNNALEEALLEKYPVDLPQSLIESDIEGRLNSYGAKLKRDNQYDYFKANYKQIRKSMEQNSRRDLQLFFLFRKVATDNQLEATDEDVQAELNRQLSLISTGQNQIDMNDRENFGNQIYALALDNKIRQFLLDKSTFVEE